MIDCKYNRDRKCLLNRYDEITVGRCMSCMAGDKNQITGLGDVVALTINLTGLWRLKPVVDRVSPKGCGCKERQKKLNKIKIKVVSREKGEYWIDKENRRCGCKAVDGMPGVMWEDKDESDGN